MEKTEVTCIKLVISGEDAAVMLDLANETLHEVALFVKMRIVRA